MRIRVGGETPSSTSGPPLALALVLVGGILLGSVGGILHFMMRARRT